MRRIRGRIAISGTGLHSGKECRVTIEPCNVSEVMMRTLTNESAIRLLRTDGTKRGSDYIYPDGERVRTCEHVFSALCGMGLYSGICVTVDGGEMPAIDGCASYLSGLIEENSYDDGETMRYATIREPITVTSEDGKRIVSAFPSDNLQITYRVEYEKIGEQMLEYVPGADDYERDIAPARTFAMKSEIEYLRSHGMALGGTLKNAILIGDEIEADGGLRWPDEFVRHKVLDMMGDIYSVGYPLRVHIVAEKAGHEMHLRLAEKIKGAMIDV